MGGETSMRPARLVMSLAATGLAFLILSAAAQATGSFSVRPGQSNPAEPITRAYFKPLLRSGGSISQTVIVSNAGARPVRLLVYPLDGLTGQTTGTVYANRRDPRRKAGLWVNPRI